jgi:diguanylate cyclase (GGDEF)-like protein
MARPEDGKAEAKIERERSASDTMPRTRAAKEKKARVLVVEDDGIVGSDIRLTLTRLGYFVIGPYVSAADSLTAVPEHKPDVVLMDIHTKGPMDGVEAAGILRERLRVPVIFLTAHSDPETLRRAGMAEPLGYVVKPFKAADLASVIEVALHRHAAENAMRERDHALAALTARLVAAIDSLDGAVLIEDQTGHVELMNDQLLSLLRETGCDDASTLQERDQVFLCLQRIVKEHSRNHMSVSGMLSKSAPGGARGQLVELIDGRVLELSVAPTIVRGSYGGCLWTFRDVTERELAKRELKELSLVDALTGLHNRRGLNTLSELLLRTALRDGRRVAVYFIDLDGMKPVNDEYGHDVGDQLLRRTADILRKTCRASDILARLGGDEFVVVSALEPPGEHTLLVRIREAEIQHNRARPGLPTVRMSIGSALSCPEQPATFEELLARADAAMYAEKQRRRGA